MDSGVIHTFRTTFQFLSSHREDGPSDSGVIVRAVRRRRRSDCSALALACPDRADDAARVMAGFLAAGSRGWTSRPRWTPGISHNFSHNFGRGAS